MVERVYKKGFRALYSSSQQFAENCARTYYYRLVWRWHEVDYFYGDTYNRYSNDNNYAQRIFRR